MGKIEIKAAGTVVTPPAPSTPAELSADDRSKDAFFAQVAEIAEAMIVRHGKDFAIGTLVLAAKFVAEGKPLVTRSSGDGGAMSAEKPV